MKDKVYELNIDLKNCVYSLREIKKRNVKFFDLLEKEISCFYFPNPQEYKIGSGIYMYNERIYFSRVRKNLKIFAIDYVNKSINQLRNIIDTYFDLNNEEEIKCLKNKINQLETMKNKIKKS